MFLAISSGGFFCISKVMAVDFDFGSFASCALLSFHSDELQAGRRLSKGGRMASLPGMLWRVELCLQQRLYSMISRAFQGYVNLPYCSDSKTRANSKMDLVLHSNLGVC